MTAIKNISEDPAALAALQQLLGGNGLFSDPDTGLNFRIAIRGSRFQVDKELTPLGFSGDESTDGGVTGDWDNIGGF